MATRSRALLVLIGLLLASIIAVQVVTGRRGASFGAMWDEAYQVEVVRKAVNTVELRSDGYYYGGLYFVPGYLLVARSFLKRLPSILEEIRAAPTRPFAPSRYPSIVEAQAAANRVLDRPDYFERSRKLFVAFNAGIVVWVFGAALLATGSAWVALAAASWVGLSWEFSYHARFVAIDALLAQCAALTLLAVNAALRAATAARERLFLRLAALAAGLGVGAKLPGVFLLLPVLAAGALSVYGGGFAARLWRAFELACIAFAAFVVTTPGVLIDPLHFAADMLRVSMDYNRISDDYQYAEPVFRTRAGKIASYLGLVLFSPFPLAALALTLLAGVGAFAGVRERRPDVVCTLLFLVAYLGFVSQQTLLIVRNLLAALPAFAILAALGIQRTFELLGRVRCARWLVPASCAALAVAQATWLWRAADSAADSSPVSLAVEAHEYIQAHPERRFHIAPDVRPALERVRADERTPLPGVPSSDADEIVVYGTSLPGNRKVERGGIRYFARRFVNYDYSPGLLTGFTKAETDRPIVAVSRERALALAMIKPK